jgi:hypothetical protein
MGSGRMLMSVSVSVSDHGLRRYLSLCVACCMGLGVRVRGGSCNWHIVAANLRLGVRVRKGSGRCRRSNSTCKSGCVLTRYTTKPLAHNRGKRAGFQELTLERAAKVKRKEVASQGQK